MKIYLVQHGESKTEAEAPHRPLTLKGEVEIRRVARLAKALGVRPHRIYHSGKLRAEQTAEIMGKTLGVAVPSIESSQGLNPTDDVKPWMERIQVEAADFMIVGHLPFLERLASFMLCANEMARIVLFQYGTLVCLDQKEDQGWAFRWMITPEMCQ